jgi:hypothetical protein
MLYIQIFRIVEREYWSIISDPNIVCRINEVVDIGDFIIELFNPILFLLVKDDNVNLLT